MVRPARVMVGVLLLALGSGCSGNKSKQPARSVGAIAPVKGPAPAPQVGTCAEVSGPVEVRRASLPYWEPVTNGVELRVGDWVRTGAGGTVRLEFNNGARLVAEENALVVVEVPDQKPDAGSVAEPAVALSRGVVRGVANADDGPTAPITVHSGGTSQRVLAAAGTRHVDYRLRATDTGTEIAVTQGSALVQKASQSIELVAGRAVMASADTLTAPLELPEFPVSVAPGIDARAVFPLERPLLLVWKPVPNATGYRVQVARDLSFTIDTRSFDVSTTSMELKPDSRGLYVWRVAAKGPGGTLSEYGFARRIYFESEAPSELLLTPEDGEVFGFAGQPPTIVFQWQAAAGAVSYRLAISKNADPQDRPVFTDTVDSQRTEVAKLTAGEYTWGVYVRPGMKPIFLSPRKLVVKQMPKPKVTAPKAIQWE